MDDSKAYVTFYESEMKLIMDVVVITNYVKTIVRKKQTNIKSNKSI